MYQCPRFDTQLRVYTGKILPCPGEPDVGASGNIVLRLVKDICEQKWHKIFYDNWFTSVALNTRLWNKGFAAIGTVRANRLGNCLLPSDKDLKKEEVQLFLYQRK